MNYVKLVIILCSALSCAQSSKVSDQPEHKSLSDQVLYGEILTDFHVNLPFLAAAIVLLNLLLTALASPLPYRSFYGQVY